MRTRSDTMLDIASDTYGRASKTAARAVAQLFPRLLIIIIIISSARKVTSSPITIDFLHILLLSPT